LFIVEMEYSTVAQVVAEFTVLNKVGIHARPAAALVQALQPFDAVVFFVKDGQRINAKSIMGVLMLAAGEGSVLVVEAEGPDAEAAVAKVRELIESKFGED
jgi:phosphocarrier protein HPr